MKEEKINKEKDKIQETCGNEWAYPKDKYKMSP